MILISCISVNAQTNFPSKPIDTLEDFDLVLYLQQTGCYCYHLDSLSWADFNSLLEEYLILEQNNCKRSNVTFGYMYFVLLNINKYLPKRSLSEIESIFKVEAHKRKNKYIAKIRYDVFFELSVKNGRVQRSKLLLYAE